MPPAPPKLDNSMNGYLGRIDDLGGLLLLIDTLSTLWLHIDNGHKTYVGFGDLLVGSLLTSVFHHTNVDISYMG